MKKAFDQTVRDLKREVNTKVLKVPKIEQKVLDATSNEPWGPHGTLLSDIALASKNYNEYQMIIGVIWRRVNDTGKNWRHVYKALTVLEYLVAHGAERVIDEIREHAYQIQTLSDFQYIDSSGRDQGSNVRKKSQSLVMLVNDKERIQELRQKATTTKDMYRTSSMGNLYRAGSRGYDGGRDRDDESRGRSRSVNNYDYSSRSRSSDRYSNRSFEDVTQYASSSTGKRLDRKYSEQYLDVTPSYEEAVAPTHKPTQISKDEASPCPPQITSAASPPPSVSGRITPPPANGSPTKATTTAVSPPAPASPVANISEPDSFDEFDPRAPTTLNVAAPSISGSTEMDLLGCLSEGYISNYLAIVPVTPFEDSANEADNFKGIPSSSDQEIDILADILPRTGPLMTNQSQYGQAYPFSQPSFQTNTVSYGGSYNQNMVPQVFATPSRSGSVSPQLALPTAPVANDKFESKSAIWADTLSRGLVNLDISGSKTNPTSDIGIDFDALNRKAKRMEKPSTTAPVISSTSMGKAMGSGSGIGRAGANSLRPPVNPMVGPRPGIAMGGAGYTVMNQQQMGNMNMGYAGMNQQMGMGINSRPGMGMGMNNQMGIGMNMQWPTNNPGGYNYNQNMGMGLGGAQQSYGRGYQ